MSRAWIAYHSSLDNIGSLRHVDVAQVVCPLVPVHEFGD